VVLNTGNIMDMNWVDTYNPGAVLYIWQGGIAGADGAADVLLGMVNPSGRLSDTIAYDLSDYPSDSNFGEKDIAVYAEDVYVGYRYFETFAKDKVRYPFGYGLSYTTFDISDAGTISNADEIIFGADVCNTGDRAGAHVVQIYVSKPQGKLGKPARELVGFAKTGVIEPGETQRVSVVVPFNSLVSYDDSGVSGFAYAYVAEAGEYSFFMGSDVRAAKQIYSFVLDETICVEQASSALAPVKAFKRIKPEACDGGLRVGYEDAPLRTYDLSERIRNNRPEDRPCSGDKGIKLKDVYSGEKTLEEFLDQISDEELICMSRGEGMCSPKVTAGTAAAFGGVTKALADFGIPAGCCADGPSGIRMDCGTWAYSMPNGTCMACTFNTELVETLYEYEGMDLRKNKVDFLLGPGVNIHRHPLNGRNFEYFSEDPYLTGIMAAYQLKGMHKQGVTGTVKHFVGNEQEYMRSSIDSVISERALREIYLKPFEMAVKMGGAYSVMTAYGAVNGVWSAGNYDLVTTILRNEWKYTGFVMTDWWAMINEEGGEPSRANTSPMIRAQNDVYMVVSDSYTNTAKDTAAEGLSNGIITRGELLRNAANICNALMNSPCMNRLVNGDTEEWKDVGFAADRADAARKVDWQADIDVVDSAKLDMSDVPTQKGNIALINLTFKKRGYFTLAFEMSTEKGMSDLAQLPISIYNGPNLIDMISITPSEGDNITRNISLVAEVVLSANVKLVFGQSGVIMHNMKVVLDEEYTVK